MNLGIVNNGDNDSLFLFNDINSTKDWDSSRIFGDIKLNSKIDWGNIPTEVKLVPIEVFEESKLLYNEIDKAIGKLISARLSDDEDSKRLAINELERCSVNTLQHLSYLISYTK